MLVLSVALAYLLNGCALFEVGRQQEKKAALCQIWGTVKPDNPKDGGLVVVLFRHKGGAVGEKANWSLADHFLRDQPGGWFFIVNPGTYYLTAFQDLNNDQVFERDEPVIPIDVNQAFACAPGETRKNLDLAIPHDGRISVDGPLDITALHVRSDDEQMNVSLGQALVFGETATLDNPSFSRENASKGLWRPYDFIWEAKPGLYFLEPYDPAKTPVLFVHGINGTPIDFTRLIEGLDRSRFQPWVYYYPSGVKVQKAGLFLDRLVMHLKARHGFKRLLVVAHSLGGLVTRSALLGHAEAYGDGLVPLLVTLSTPWSGHRAAQLGVDFAPTAIHSWIDLAPGSQFLQGLFQGQSGSERRRLPAGIDHHLIFTFLTTESGDGMVSLASQLREEAQEEAKQLHGLVGSHMGALDDPKTSALVNRLLVEASDKQ